MNYVNDPDGHHKVGCFPDGRRSALTGILHRDGVGEVAWVVEFPDGVVVTRWAVTDVRQTCVWASLDDMFAVHGHDGTTLEWMDG